MVTVPLKNYRAVPVEPQGSPALAGQAAGGKRRRSSGMRGFTAASALSPVWADPKVCLAGETPLGCEYRLQKPVMDFIMLGTNDLKHRFGLSAWDIAAGMGALVDIVQRSGFGVNGAAPRVLVICPPPVARLSLFEELFSGAAEKSQQMARHYAVIAADRRCAFLDAGQVIASSDVDGIHLGAGQQQKLGQAVAEAVKAILA